jgi:two-component system, LytTR family, response regulator
VTSGKSTRVIQVEEIIFLSVSSPYVVIHTLEGKYLYQKTLKEMLKSLASPPFLQIHKSHLINLDQVKSYQSRLNGDYDVLMKNGVALRLSRTYATRFKQAFG